jgi:hypothetical protein
MAFAAYSSLFSSYSRLKASSGQSGLQDHEQARTEATSKIICQYEIPGGGLCRDLNCKDMHLRDLEGEVGEWHSEV